MKYGKEVDVKWTKKWEEDQIYDFKFDDDREKLYVLEMFSYPSSSTLHLGHWFNYAPLDTYSRFKRMNGFNVFHPMGFDAFGLPAENYAIKHGIHPQDSTLENIEIMKKQLKGLGGDYDWNYTLETCNENYYKWTQWLFLKLYNNDLAYKKEAPVNWCPSCNTVLANEQVKNGLCDRCSTPVTRKKFSQWFFKITDYAEQLIDDLDELDWPESTKKVQLNWIGKSIGSTIDFKVENSDKVITVFTTRADTLNGVTYVVLSPENKLTLELTTDKQRKEVKEYIERSSNFSDIERMETNREKTGVFTGSYAINPINNKHVPIWTSDYVLENYGTGCVMAVPAHDDRDYEFAKKFNLEIIPVIKNKENDILPMTDDGILINSGDFNNLTSEEARNKVTNYLKENNQGDFTTNYRLKDWLVSRQRYWGAPIPIVYCPNCGMVPEKEENLPVKLPYNVEFRPDGVSPLAKSEEFKNCKCPNCGGNATREVDTLDTFVCSSWYFLRYPNTHIHDKPFDKNIVEKMLPVDVYVGGNEHAAMHLIYARFITKVLKDLGYININEPFKKLRHQGMILGTDGNKMSKSKGNTVTPDFYIDQYGADVFRAYLMFGFAYNEGGPWKNEGVPAMAKYFNRIESLYERIKNRNDYSYNEISVSEEQLITVLNKTILGIEIDMEKLQFNTVLSKTMELINEIVSYEQNEIINLNILKESFETFIKVFAPIAPFFSEEIWYDMGNTSSIHLQSWPKADISKIKDDTVEIAIQVNGKLRGTIVIKKDEEEQKVRDLALKVDNIIAHTLNKDIKKVIYIKNKIINIVV